MSLAISKRCKLIASVVLRRCSSGLFQLVSQFYLVQMIISQLLSRLTIVVVVSIQRNLFHRLHHLLNTLIASLHDRLLRLVVIVVPLIYLLQVILNLLGPYLFAECTRLFSSFADPCRH